MNGVVKDDVYRPSVDRAGLRASLGLTNGEAMVLHTGRMFHWKRIDRHLRVLRRALDVFDGFRAIFIGDGAEFAAMKQLCHELGLVDRARFLGAMSHDEVMNYLNACDVYISFYDLSNLSNSLIESCVCGKCIVTTNVGGTGHLLVDGINGVVVCPHDDEVAIAAGLVRVLKDPAERDRLAQGAFRRGQALETWAQRMESEVAEVERVLQDRQISPAAARRPA
jgi:glycosyltransferase involved in cell wall biosynthesis